MILLFLNKLWGYVKPHVVPMLLVLAACIAGYVLLSRQKSDLVTQLQKQQTINDEEMKKLKDAQDKERKAHEENSQKLETDLNNAKKNYDEKIKKLEDRKTEQVNQLVKKYKDDPVGMAKQLSDVTGFPLVVPEK